MIVWEQQLVDPGDVASMLNTLQSEGAKIFSTASVHTDDGKTEILIVAYRQGPTPDGMVVVKPGLRARRPQGETGTQA